MTDMTQQERCDKAAQELRDIMDKYAVQVEVDVTDDPPLIFMVCREESEPERKFH